ncbi:MAG: hypothetical protein IH604_09085 [Burkholderiales bacterium]|nr:hypothetical protein [Burkholderiales bacterium]
MKRLVLIAALLVPSVASAQLVTGGDMFTRLNTEQSSAYLDGVMEALSYEWSTNGKKNKAACAIDWYYRTGGKTQRLLFDTFDRYKDKPVVGLLKAYIDRKCGK